MSVQARVQAMVMFFSCLLLFIMLPLSFHGSPYFTPYTITVPESACFKVKIGDSIMVGSGGIP